jgi:hypothetical protein
MTRSCLRRSSWAASAVVRRGCWHGTRMTRHSAQIHAQQRLQLQGDGSVRLCGPARLSRPSAKSARHGALHESSANDPAPARGMGRHSPSPLPTMGWIAASPRPSSARTSFDGSSSRRTRGSMTRRFASWAGLHCSEAADPHDAQGTSSIHDPQGWPIFLPTRAEGDALSLDAARLKDSDEHDAASAQL